MKADKLRILALNWRCLRHPQAGGSEINLFEQARRWVRDGHDVTVFSADPGRAVAPERDEVINGVQVCRRGGQFTVYLYAAFYLLTQGWRFDRVLDVANGIPFFAPLFCGRPVTLLIHHVHDRQWFAEFPSLAAVMGRFLECRVVPVLYARRSVIAVSPTTRDAVIAIGFSESLVHVVYNGVTEAPDHGHGIQPVSQHRVTYVGRLKRYKRIDRLVRAVAQLRYDFPDIHLDIVGDGDARPELESLITNLDLEDSVTLHGFVDSATKAFILQSATVFAAPSMHEGWGLSVIEANAHGCPAVAYDVPGLRVAIRHGETGLLARDGDDEGFRAAIGALLADGGRRQRYADAARRWAKSFDWETCARTTLNIMREGSAMQPATTFQPQIDVAA